MAKTWYVAAGATGSLAANDADHPSGLAAVWAGIGGAGPASGDTIQLADGTYNNTTTDVPVAGLGDISGDYSITVRGNPTNPSSVFIDFSGNNAGVDGFNITCTGTNTWTFDGLTLYGARGTSPEGIINFADGTLYVNNCVIYSNKILGNNGVRVYNGEIASKGYFYNSEFYGFPNDCITMGTNLSAGKGGAAADRLLEAHYCYFHDCDTGTAQQGMTMHTDGAEEEGATCKAYFCTFENFNGTLGCAVGHDAGSNQHTYIYNSIINNCITGVMSTGISEIRNSEINVSGTVFNTSNGTGDVLFENDIIDGGTTGSGLVILSSSNVNLTVRSCLIKNNTTTTTVATFFNSGSTAKSFTLEDSFIYIPNITDKLYVCQSPWETFNINRNLIWSNSNITGSFGLFWCTTTNPTIINLSDNCIYKPGTNAIFYISAALADTTYNGGYNTWLTEVPLSSPANRMPAKSTDQTGTISLRGFSIEAMLSENATHYRTKGAAMMPGWFRPKGSMNMGTFCRRPIK